MTTYSYGCDRAVHVPLFYLCKSKEWKNNLFRNGYPAMSCELIGKNQTKPEVVVAIVRAVVVAISGAAIIGVVVPTATTIHAVRTRDYFPKPMSGATFPSYCRGDLMSPRQ